MLNNPSEFDYLLKVKPGITRWVIPGWHYTSCLANAVALTSGRIYYIPIFLEEISNLIRVGAYISTASVNGIIDIRIFRYLRGLPGALILNCGTIDTSVAPAAVEIIIALTLPRGYYFLAYRPNALGAAAILFGADTQKAVTAPVTGMAIALGGAVSGVIPYADSAYADPAPAPSGVVGSGFASMFLREN